MPRALKPVPGVRDQLGTSDVPWAQAFISEIFDEAGHPYVTSPADASIIQTGTLLANVIGFLNQTVVINTMGGGPGTVTIGQMLTAALLGAQDPVARINAGTSLIQGHIAPGTLDPNAISQIIAMASRIILGLQNGCIQSPDWQSKTTGFLIGYLAGNQIIEVNLATALWQGILSGSININSLFMVDNTGKTQWGDPTAKPPLLHGISNTGEEFWGSDIYANAQAQMDDLGNFFLADGPQSQSYIDLGAIGMTCHPPQASPGGGHYSGNVTLTPGTRLSHIYYTTDGSNPADPTNGSRVLYTVPFAVAPGPSVVVKACCEKLNVYSSVITWTFYNSDTACATPVISPSGGFYTSSTGTLAISITDGTTGATVYYTTDGSTPSPTNGSVYVSPFNIGPGSISVKAIAVKAGISNSSVASVGYNVTRGGGQGSSGGGGHIIPP